MALHNYIYYKHSDTLVNKIARPHDPRPQALHCTTSEDEDDYNSETEDTRTLKNDSGSLLQHHQMQQEESYYDQNDEYTSIFDLYHKGDHHLSLGVSLNEIQTLKNNLGLSSSSSNTDNDRQVAHPIQQQHIGPYENDVHTLLMDSSSSSSSTLNNSEDYHSSKSRMMISKIKTNPHAEENVDHIKETVIKKTRFGRSIDSGDHKSFYVYSDGKKRKLKKRKGRSSNKSAGLSNRKMT